MPWRESHDKYVRDAWTSSTGSTNGRKALEEGMLYIHRDIEGFDHWDGPECPCCPFAYPIDTLKTPQQIVKEVSIDDRRH